MFVFSLFSFLFFLSSTFFYSVLTFVDILSPDLDKLPQLGTNYHPITRKPLILPSTNSSPESKPKTERKITPRTAQEIQMYKLPFKMTPFYLIAIIAVVILEQRRNELFS